MLTFEHAGVQFLLRDEPTYTPRSVDNVRRYDREIPLCDAREFYSKHGVTASTADQTHSAILLGCGGLTVVHEHSAIAYDDTLFVACGESVCALMLPNLALAWLRKADDATCLGIHRLPGGAGLISHGELTIARLSLAGDVVWSTGGRDIRDIFTGEFTVLGDRVRAVDWEGAVFEFALSDGRELVVGA